MADTARRVEYYYVTVPDTVGEGDRILAALRDSGVNLLAYLGFPLGGGQSQLDLVPEEPESLKEAAARAGITLSEAKWAFLVQGDDRVGAVAETTGKLAEANITVTAAAATGAGAGRYGRSSGWLPPTSSGPPARLVRSTAVLCTVDRRAEPCVDLGDSQSMRTATSVAFLAESDVVLTGD